MRPITQLSREFVIAHICGRHWTRGERCSTPVSSPQESIYAYGTGIRMHAHAVRGHMVPIEEVDSSKDVATYDLEAWKSCSFERPIADLIRFTLLMLAALAMMSQLEQSLYSVPCLLACYEPPRQAWRWGLRPTLVR